MIDANPARDLGFGELDDDLSIVIPSLEGPCEVFRPLSSGDQPPQPRTVRPGQCFGICVPDP